MGRTKGTIKRSTSSGSCSDGARRSISILRRRDARASQDHGWWWWRQKQRHWVLGKHAGDAVELFLDGRKMGRVRRRAEHVAVETRLQKQGGAACHANTRSRDRATRVEQSRAH